jgi:hypothetical protein
MHVFWKVKARSGGPAYVECSIVSSSSQPSGHMNIGCPVPSTPVIGPCNLSVHGSLLDIPYTLGGQVCPTPCGKSSSRTQGNYALSRSTVSPAVISTFHALESLNSLGWLACPVVALGTPQN